MAFPIAEVLAKQRLLREFFCTPSIFLLKSFEFFLSKIFKRQLLPHERERERTLTWNVVSVHRL